MKRTEDYSDTELLDYLEGMLDREEYTGEAILRWSETSRGMRLHETSREGAADSIRKAIIQHMEGSE